MISTGQHLSKAQRLVEEIKKRGVREHHTETRAEHLPEDVRQGIEEIRKAIPDIFKRIQELESKGSGDLDSVYVAMKNLTELIQQLGAAKKQMVVQGNDIDARVRQLDGDVQSLHAAFRKMVSAVADLGGMVKSVDDSEKTEAA